MKHRELINVLLSTYPQLPYEHSCDGFKFGQPEDECTGVVTSCALTIDVIKEAAHLGHNLIIVHEPAFYTHDDDTPWLADNAVYQQKKRLLETHHIAVWRNHDHMHVMKPDEIMIGVLQELGWQDLTERAPDGFCFIVTLPKTTVRELAVHLKEKLNVRAGRIVGDLDSYVSRVAFCGHVFPSWDAKEREATELLSRQDVDVLIPGELIDWTVTSYARDAQQLSMNKAILQMGHFCWEEPGMKWFAKRLAALAAPMPVQFVPSGDPYQFV